MAPPRRVSRSLSLVWGPFLLLAVLKGVHSARKEGWASVMWTGAGSESQSSGAPEYEGTGSRRRLGEEHEGCETGPEYANFTHLKDWLNLLGVIVCTCSAATAAGLTLGMVSLDPLELRLKHMAGTEEEKRHSGKLLPLIERHHLLLTTMLLFNATANETLPIFLDKMVPSAVAICISVTLVLFFGEIIPSAILTGPRQLELAAKFSPVAWMLIGLFFIFAWPISKVLDYLLGHGGLRLYTRRELAALMGVQQGLHEDNTRRVNALSQSRAAAASLRMETATGAELQALEDQAAVTANGLLVPPSPSQAPVTQREADMLRGILAHTHAPVKKFITPIDKTYCVSMDACISPELKEELATQGFSRVPVYDKHPANIRGFVQIKRLIALDSAPMQQKVFIHNLHLNEPVVAGEDTTLGLLLKDFQEGKAHMAVISKNPAATEAALLADQPLEGDAQVLGIVTLEDVLEELLQTDISDEMDRSREHPMRRKMSILKSRALRQSMGLSPSSYRINSTRQLSARGRNLELGEVLETHDDGSLTIEGAIAVDDPASGPLSSVAGTPSTLASFAADVHGAGGV